MKISQVCSLSLQILNNKRLESSREKKNLPEVDGNFSQRHHNTSHEYTFSADVFVVDCPLTTPLCHSSSYLIWFPIRAKNNH